MLYCIAQDSIPEQPEIKAVPKKQQTLFNFQEEG
jgi:hypothetical protein